jgi:hyaluronoglucosaminidase
VAGEARVIRGVIEGFYGAPWRQAERIDLIRFCGDAGFDTWVHAPKDDPYHRQRWRDLYPAAELERFAELVQVAKGAGVRFTYAIAPGLSIDYSSDGDFDALLAKSDQLRSVGVEAVQLLWDDIEPTPESGRLQSELSNRFASEFEQASPLVICPIGYAGTGDSTYRRAMRESLDRGIVVYWTGPEVVSLAIAREELDAAVERFGDHDLLLWDNYPVNDFAPDTVFLGPLRARDPRLWRGRAAGLVANGMLQAAANKLPLATVGEYLRDPDAYDPIAAFERALGRYGAEVVASLRGEGVPNVASVPDVGALVDALALGVDAATGAALLERFV